MCKHCDDLGRVEFDGPTLDGHAFAVMTDADGVPGIAFGDVDEDGRFHPTYFSPSNHCPQCGRDLKGEGQ